MTAELAHLRLAASCTIREAADLKSALMAFESSDEVILLDGSQVEQVDTAGLQLLLAYSQQLAKRGHKIAWTGVSPALLKGSQRLGLGGALGIMPAATDQ